MDIDQLHAEVARLQALVVALEPDALRYRANRARAIAGTGGTEADWDALSDAAARYVPKAAPDASA